MIFSGILFWLTFGNTADLPFNFIFLPYGPQRTSIYIFYSLRQQSFSPIVLHTAKAILNEVHVPSTVHLRGQITMQSHSHSFHSTSLAKRLTLKKIKKRLEKKNPNLFVLTITVQLQSNRYNAVRRNWKAETKRPKTIGQMRKVIQEYLYFVPAVRPHAV